MIDVHRVLEQAPRFETFCSVQRLRDLAAELSGDGRFSVDVAGISAGGQPIHHIRFGSGPRKAMLVGGVHAMEPIGSVTVASLLRMLQNGVADLTAAPVEWHIIPCIDPDGAVLNEGWSQQRFSFPTFTRNYYQQAYCDQADMSFAVSHKRLQWDRPAKEAVVLRDLLDRVRPDFYFPLHNSRVGGVSYFISRDIGPSYYADMYALLEQLQFPLQRRPIWKDVYEPFGVGIMPTPTVKAYYDFLERTAAQPEQHIPEGWGAFSHEYLASIKPDALSFIAELGYGQHPSDQSIKGTGENLRRFKLRIDALSKFLGSVLIAEWDRVHDKLDPANPFYRAKQGGTVFPDKDKLVGGGFPVSRYTLQDTLFNPQNDREMTEGERFDVCIVDGGFSFLHQSYQFVRLLKSSASTPEIKASIDRLEPLYDKAIAEIGRHVDFDAFQIFNCNTLAQVQLGSGLIALNSILR